VTDIESRASLSGKTLKGKRESSRVRRGSSCTARMGGVGSETKKMFGGGGKVKDTKDREVTGAKELIGARSAQNGRCI